MSRNFAFIRENALTNNRIGANERVRPDEKVPRGNKLTTGVRNVVIMVKIRVKQLFIHLSNCRTPVEQCDTRIDSRDI